MKLHKQFCAIPSSALQARWHAKYSPALIVHKQNNCCICKKSDREGGNYPTLGT
jgi:hypothetical protein